MIGVATKGEFIIYVMGTVGILQLERVFWIAPIHKLYEYNAIHNNETNEQFKSHGSFTSHSV